MKGLKIYCRQTLGALLFLAFILFTTEPPPPSDGRLVWEEGIYQQYLTIQLAHLMDFTGSFKFDQYDDKMRSESIH